MGLARSWLHCLLYAAIYPLLINDKQSMLTLLAAGSLVDTVTSHTAPWHGAAHQRAAAAEWDHGASPCSE